MEVNCSRDSSGYRSFRNKTHAGPDYAASAG